MTGMTNLVLLADGTRDPRRPEGTDATRDVEATVRLYHCGYLLSRPVSSIGQSVSEVTQSFGFSSSTWSAC